MSGAVGAGGSQAGGASCSGSPRGILRSLSSSLRAKGTGASLMLVVISLMAPAAASADPLGVVGFWGNPSAAASGLGGHFGATPGQVAVNDASGKVYVADTGNNRLQRFSASGAFEWAVGYDVVAPGKPGNVARNEQQTITVGSNTTGGTYTLRFGGTNATHITAAIAWNASAAQVDAALEALPAVGAGGAAVSGPDGGPYAVEWVGALADQNVGQPVSNVTNLVVSGGTKAVTTSTTVHGANLERCTVAADCKAGVGALWVTGFAPFQSDEPGGALAGPTGVAVNQVTGDVYVTDTAYSRIQQFDANGVFVRAWGSDVVRPGASGDRPAASAVQTLTVDATAGSFRLAFQGQTTSDLAFDATSAQVDSALEGLSMIGAGNVAVTGGPGATSPMTITFSGALANAPQPPIAASNGAPALSGGTASATIADTVTGATGFEVCAAAVDCKRGSHSVVGGGFSSTALSYPTVVPVGAPNAGNVLVGDGQMLRVQEFTAAGEFVRAFGYNVVTAGPGQAGSGFEICRVVAFDTCGAGAAGNGVGQFNSIGGQTPNIRVAVDSAGTIFTAEALANFRVQRFTPSGGTLTPSAFNPAISGTESLTGSAAVVGAADLLSPSNLAVDPADDHLYVVRGFGLERRVLEFDTTGAGTLLDSHIAGYGVASVVGLAVKSGGEHAYLTSTTGAPRVYELGEPTPPTVTVQPTTDVTSSSALLHGTITPNNAVDPAPLHTFWRFEYSADGGAHWTKAPATDVDGGTGAADIVVSQEIADLEPNKAYAVRLVASKGGAPVISTGDVGAFSTDPAPPVAETLDAYWDGDGKLTLRGLVNPNNQPTSYYIEYGTDTGYGQRIPADQDGDAGGGGAPVAVAQQISGLEPDATYHYRVVAVNATGTTSGSDRTIGSFRPPPPRVAEWVSRGDSWGIGVNAIGAIADDGDRAGFVAQLFGQPDTVPGPVNPVMARRTPTGWVPAAQLPAVDGTQGGYFNTYFMSRADGTATLWPEGTRSGRQRGEVGWVLVHQDGTRTPAGPMLEPLPADFTTSGIDNEYRLQGAAADLSTFVFGWRASDGVRFFADEPIARGLASQLYAMSRDDAGDWKLSVVNRASDPSPEVAGPVIGGVCGAKLGALLGETTTGPVNRAISEDGSAIYFTIDPNAPASGFCGSVNGDNRRLFKRVGGTSTVAVSAPQCSGVCVGSGPDLFQSASRDGSVVAFLSPRQLTDSDDDTTNDLYIYDASPPAGQPTLVQASAGEVVAGDAIEVLDLSADGSRVYFTARGVLAGAGAQGAAVAGQPNLYVFERSEEHPAGRTALVAGAVSVAGGDSAVALPNSNTDGGGRWLVFTTRSRVLADDTDGARDVYRFDDLTGRAECLSCVGGGNVDVTVALPGGDAASEQSPADGWLRGRAVSADGSTVVFATREALVEADDNTEFDVYQWQGGTLSLVSSQTGEQGLSVDPASKVPAAPVISGDGRAVFFITRAGIDPADRNNVEDVYGARIGGGFEDAPAPPTPCDVLAAQCQDAGFGSIPSDTRTSPSGRKNENATAKARKTLALSSISAKARRKVARSGRLSLVVRTSSAGRVSLTAKARMGRKTIRVGRTSVRADEGGSTRVDFRLSSRARRQLHSGKGLRVKIEASQPGARARTMRILLPGVRS